MQQLEMAFQNYRHKLECMRLYDIGRDWFEVTISEFEAGIMAKQSFWENCRCIRSIEIGRHIYFMMECCNMDQGQ